MITSITGVCNLEVDPSCEYIECLVPVDMTRFTKDEVAALHKRQARVTVVLCR